MDFRSSGILEHLFRAGWADARRFGAKAVVCLIDRWLVDVFRNTYCLPFVPIGVPHYHMGGNVIPLTMATSREAMMEIARNSPPSFAFWVYNLPMSTVANRYVEGPYAPVHEEVTAFDLDGLVPTEAPSSISAV